MELIKKNAIWKFIIDVVHDFASSLQPDVGRGFLHVSNVFLFQVALVIPMYIGYDYTAYMDYMDPAVHYPRKAVKLNHPPTHWLDISDLNKFEVW